MACTLKVPQLDKYIEHNKLSKKGKKIDKIKQITAHYYETSKESTIPSSVSVGEDSDESESDNDLVLYSMMKVKAKVNLMMTVIL